MKRLGLAVCTLLACADTSADEALGAAYKKARSAAPEIRNTDPIEMDSPSSGRPAHSVVQDTPTISEIRGWIEASNRAYSEAIRREIQAGLSALERGQTDDAIAALEEAAKLERRGGVKGGNATLFLGWAYLLAGNAGDAADAFEAATKNYPEHASGWEYLGHAYRRLGKTKKASAAYLEALSLKRETTGALIGLATTFETGGDLPAAIAVFDEWIQSCRKTPCKDEAVVRVSWEYGALLERAGRIDEAIAIYGMLRVYSQSKVGACVRIALVEGRRGNVDASIRWNTEAIALDPSAAIAIHNLGIDQLAKKKPGPALVHLRRAAELDPGEKLYQENLDAVYRANRLDRKEVDAWTKAAFVESAMARANKAEIEKQLDLLAAVVTARDTPMKRREGVMLGLMSADSEREGLVSPLTGDAIPSEAVGALGTHEIASELSRGIQDNQWTVNAYRTFDNFSLDNEAGRKLLARWKGAEFERLYAHSNGATVAIALLNKKWITVQELHVIGGDRTLVNEIALRTLVAEGRVKRVVVWLHGKDPIPYASSTPPSASLREFAVYLARGVEGAPIESSLVEYRVLDGACPAGIFGCHDLRGAYFPQMRAATSGTP